MEIYDSCGACGKWTDLVRWQNEKKITLISVCSDCYNRLDAHSIRPGQTKTNAVKMLLEEMEKR